MKEITINYRLEAFLKDGWTISTRWYPTVKEAKAGLPTLDQSSPCFSRGDELRIVRRTTIVETLPYLEADKLEGESQA